MLFTALKNKKNENSTDAMEVLISSTSYDKNCECED